jgi:hypothetical protein
MNICAKVEYFNLSVYFPLQGTPISLQRALTHFESGEQFVQLNLRPADADNGLWLRMFLFFFSVFSLSLESMHICECISYPLLFFFATISYPLQGPPLLKYYVIFFLSQFYFDLRSIWAEGGFSAPHRYDMILYLA